MTRFNGAVSRLLAGRIWTPAGLLLRSSANHLLRNKSNSTSDALQLEAIRWQISKSINFTFCFLSAPALTVSEMLTSQLFDLQTGRGHEGQLSVSEMLASQLLILKTGQGHEGQLSRWCLSTANIKIYKSRILHIFFGSTLINSSQV